MRADFLDAFERHLQDAELLLESSRLANADHLFGIAVECGLKQLMLKFGMPYDTTRDRPAEKDDQAHANRIWDRFENYRSGHALGMGYALAIANPFHDWDISDRYAHRTGFDEQRALQHRQGADIVNKLMQQARRDGWL